MSSPGQGCADLPGFVDCRIVQRSQRHLIYRARRPDGGPAVVIKATVPDADAEALSALRQEYELLQTLRLPGVVRAFELVHLGDGLGIVLADVGARTLGARLASGPLALQEFLALAIQLAGVLASLHDARVIHRDVNPSNLVLDAAEERLTLIDFGLATSVVTAAPAATSPWQLSGTLAYLSPEQAGRTGRSVDHRTDLYALGATLYEMLTGGPPFEATDPVELVHAHMALQPVPPCERDPAIPRLLSDLVSKLLAKEPEARYQSAGGVERDLCRARDGLTATGAIAPFELARDDRPETLQIPAGLYGREAALQELAAALATNCGGARELVLVVGEPGVGKSAFLSQGLAAHWPAGGAIATGKFDQLQRGVPYAEIAQAFRRLLRQLSTAPEPALAAWRARVQAALGVNGHIVAEVVPELGELLGPQPPVAALEPLEARNRFNLTFGRFAAALADAEHPLVLVLDDLQWIDSASLSLFTYLAKEADVPCLRLLGAYREQAVGTDHPLAAALDELRRAGVTTRTIRLSPLAPDDLAQLCADALQLPTEEVRPLASLLHRKTAGNPLFVHRLLRTLHDDGWLSFDARARRWRWDLDAIARVGFADSAVDMMLDAIGRLPAPSAKLLELAAGLGHRVELGLLAALTGCTRNAVISDLEPAVAQGLVQPLDASGMTFQFAHDRVQQAAYARLAEPERLVLHLRIGRLMQAEASGEERLFDVADHLNLGSPMIDGARERQDLARLNLQAARKAQASAAPAAALAFVNAGLALLPADAWAHQADLAFDLHQLGAEAAYVTGDFALAERLVATASPHAPSPEAQADLQRIRVLAATVAGDYTSALAAGVDGLARLGIALPRTDLAAAVAAETAAVLARLDSPQRIAALLDAPEMEDPPARASMRLLSTIFPLAYIQDPAIMAFVNTRMVALSLQYGRTAYAAEAYVQFALGLLGDATGDMATPFAFGRLALDLTRHYAHPAHTAKVLTVFVGTVNPWHAPLRTGLPLIREAFQAGLDGGDLQWASYASAAALYTVFELGVPLAEVLHETEAGVAFVGKFGNKLVLDTLASYRQAVLSLQGRTIAPGSFEDQAFDETRFLEQAAVTPFAVGHYEILRLRVAYLFGDQAAARRWAKSAVGRLAYLHGQFAKVDHAFFTALNLVALWPAGTPDERAAWLSEIEASQARLAAWAENAPANFRHKARLVAAERARLEGRDLEAMALYSEAVEGAQAEGFVQDEALADELAGRFFLALGQRRIARMHLRAASTAYARWGAEAKVTALAREFPTWAAPTVSDSVSGGGTAMAAQLDAISLLKAAQALSGELELDRLLEKLLHISIEAAGATSGALLLNENGVLSLRARSVAGERHEVRLERMEASQVADLPQAILRYVARSRETVVMAHAAHDPLFVSDPVVSRGLRSVLCLPIANQGRLNGLLYLENDLVIGAFGADRVQLLQLLSTQMAISLENAALITDLKQAAIVVLNSPAVLFRWRASEGFPVEYVSENVERVFGYPPRALLTGEVPFMAIVHPDDRERLGAEIADVLASDQARHTFEYRIVSPGGAVRWVEGISWFERDAAGRIHHSQAILMDVSERKQADEERTRLLLSAQAARAEVEAARELDRLKTTFVNAISHDLRTPLTSVLGYAEFLEDGLGGPLSEGQRRFVTQILKSTERLDHLVNDLLDFARVEAGTFELTLAEADLAALVDEVLDSLRPQAQNAQLELATDLPAEPLVVRMDAPRVERALTNLVANAIQFTPDGGRIIVRVRREEGGVRCEVTDTGIGIAPEDQPKLFHRFVQLPAGAQRKGGTGLGLSISRAIVEAHGGRIGVESVVGQGSTFWFTLPTG